MDRLWAPWRLSYVSADQASRPTGDFILAADQADPARDRVNMVVTRSELSIVMLNRYPYNNGHLLIAPRRAVADLCDLTPDELLDGQRELASMIRLLRELIRADGFNVGLNLGRSAGAGLPEHLHWHLVPRWTGDINFMTTVADARVIVQSLDELWLRLRRALSLPTELPSD